MAPFPSGFGAFHSFQSACSPKEWGLKNVGNGRGSSKFHFQRDWKAISDGNSISNAVGSPLCGRNSISNVIGRPFGGANSISNVIGRPFGGPDSISNAVGSLLRGRNGISNVLGRLYRLPFSVFSTKGMMQMPISWMPGRMLSRIPCRKLKVYWPA